MSSVDLGVLAQQTNQLLASQHGIMFNDKLLSLIQLEIESKKQTPEQIANNLWKAFNKGPDPQHYFQRAVLNEQEKYEPIGPA